MKDNKTVLAAALQIAQIISWLAVPIILAVGGWKIQQSVADANTAKGYVDLAISIVTKPRGTVDPSLRSWAWDLLNEKSPTKFSREILERLKSGEVALAAPMVAGFWDLTGKGQYTAKVDSPLTVKVWAQKGGEILNLRPATFGLPNVIAGVLVTDDDQLAVRFADGLVARWSLPDGKLVSKSDRAKSEPPYFEPAK